MNVSIHKLLDLDFYSEGPAVDAAGNFFFTTLAGRQVIRWQSGQGSTVWANCTCPNGQVIAKNGEHWICESTRGQITAYHADGSFKGVVVSQKCDGIAFSTPNDLLLDSKGNLFFTDSVRYDGKVFFVGAGGEEKLIADGIDYANGLALNAAEDRLFVAESYGNRILVFDLAKPGQAELIKAIPLPAHQSGDPGKNLPDGLAVDSEGRIWVAHYGMQAIHILSPEGLVVDTFDTGLPLTSNLTFVTEGPDRKELLITGGYGEPGPGAVLLATVQWKG
ncbi:SMP-30/gluconolactonase/LRE family protein [Larkinella bovis]|uniref:SMP-30/gluconolactonase/LRE family protein n=1 Tax=Larkinella bovis TaxID=683041 RepID=A0ABW0IFG6_9BACT